jgi:hypothetical protein
MIKFIPLELAIDIIFFVFEFSLGTIVFPWNGHFHNYSLLAITLDPFSTEPGSHYYFEFLFITLIGKKTYE